MNRLSAFLMLAILGTAGPAFASAPEQDRLGGDFTLTDHHGNPFSLSSLRGKVVMLFFGYIYCPDVCPLTMAMAGQVLDSLGERSEQVVPLFVSLDPMRDKPDVLAPYVAHFHPRIVGLTGDPGKLKQVAEQYHVRHALHGDTRGEHYTLDHTAHLFLLNRGGRVAAIVPFGLSVEHLQEKVVGLLDDGAA
jgi:cytochrome oxidase Cu insertion factor (SCO1/SenC/PrrC family)